MNNFKDIKLSNQRQFKIYLKNKIETRTLEYLKGKIREKGNNLKYEIIEMKPYLMSNVEMRIDEKQMAFKIRTRILNIKGTMTNKHTKNECEVCAKHLLLRKEMQEHIFNCVILNRKHPVLGDFPSTGEMENSATGGIPQYWGNAEF